MQDPRLTWSVTEAAMACGISERTLRELIARGEFPVVRIGRRVVIVRSQLEEWLNEKGAVAV
jgi:excisionase family DNA binding protein